MIWISGEVSAFNFLVESAYRSTSSCSAWQYLKNSRLEWNKCYNCQKWTYQENTNNTKWIDSCVNASIWYYVDYKWSPNQIKCPDWTYQKEEWQSYCKVVMKWKYIKDNTLKSCGLPKNAKFKNLTLVHSDNVKSVFNRFKEIKKNNYAYNEKHKKIKDDIDNKRIWNTSDSCSFICNNWYKKSDDWKSCIKEQEKCNQWKYWNNTSFSCNTAAKWHFVWTYNPITWKFSSSWWETSQTECPDWFYQDEKWKNNCKKISFSNIWKKINSDKTWVESCTWKPEHWYFSQWFDESWNCNISCKEWWTTWENTEICWICATWYTADENNSCISNETILNNNIFKFKRDFNIDWSSNSSGIDFSIENFTSSWEIIKNEINTFFSNEDFKDFNVLNNEDWTYKWTYTWKILLLLNDYSSYISSYSWSISEYNNLISQKNNIISNFNTFIWDNSKGFDFTENTNNLNNIISEIWINNADNPEWIFWKISELKNNLTNKKSEIKKFYEDFLSKKEEIKNNLRESFNNKKSEYLNNFEELENFSDKSLDFLDNEELVITYFTWSTILIPDFNKEDFYWKISSYTWTISDLNALKESVLFDNKSLSDINFNLNSTPKINKQYLDEKISDLDKRINNYNSKINNLSTLESEIESDFSIFDLYKNNHPNSSILNIEYQNKEKVSIGIENNRFASNIYNSNIDKFNFTNKWVLKWEITIKDSDLYKIIKKINFDEIKDFSSLWKDYSKKSRIEFIKNLIVSKFQDKLQEISSWVVSSIEHINTNIDSEDYNVEDIKISNKIIRTKKDSEDIISNSITDKTKNLDENIKSQNDLIVNYTKNPFWNDKEEKMKDSGLKINLLKKQLIYLKQQEFNMLNLWYIKWCSPNEVIAWSDWMKYAWPEWLISCSKSDFKNNIDKLKWKIFDWLFSLMSIYTEQFNWYKNNLISDAYIKWNIVVNSDWDSICKAWSVDLWNWCSYIWKIKTKWIAYWSDAWAIIMDPFDCYNNTDPETCMKDKNWLRLVNEDWKIKLKWIVYSSEVGPIKFWLGINDIDVWFESINPLDKYSTSWALAISKEDERIAKETYGDILSKNYISFYDDDNWFFWTWTISTNLDSVFTNNYSDFSNLNLLWNDDLSRTLNIKNIIKEKFYSKLNSLITQSEKINNDYLKKDIANISLQVSSLDLNSLSTYNLNIFNRIKSLWLISDYVNNDLTLNFPNSSNDFLNDVKIISSNPWLYSYVSSNYWSIKSNLSDYLINIRKKELDVSNSISSWDLISNISASNSWALAYTSIWSISWNNIENKIIDTKTKINFLKKQLDYLKDQELNMVSYSIIPWCKPWMSKTINWIEYNNEGKLPCSKRLFQSKIKEWKEKILDWLFSLLNIYKKEINSYIANANNNLKAKWNMIINWDWITQCKLWSIKLWDWCVELSNIKIKWIAYWSDSWPVILDPFGCSDKNNKTLINKCRTDNNWLRLEVDNWSVKLKWIVYSPEIWAIKFWWIWVDLDAWFGTVQ